MNGPTRSALDRLVPPGQADFAERVWGRTPLFVPNEARGGDAFDDLFGLAAVDELLTNRGLRTPFVRMARQGRTLPESAFTAPGGVGAGISDQIDPDKVRRLYADGASIVLQALHRTWPPVVELGQQLATDLGHPTQVNAYLTPAQNQGFAAHYDVHDVFVLQVHGTKHWRSHPPVLALPHRDEPWNDRAEEVGAAAAATPLLEVQLRPGDVLYLPRGYVHAARACGVASLHLTIGIHPWTGRHLADALLAAAAEVLRDSPVVRAALPIGGDVADAEFAGPGLEHVRSALLEAIGDLDPAAALSTLDARAAGAQRAAPLPPLAQLAAADGLLPGTRVRLRRHLRLRTAAEGQETVATSRVGSVRLDAPQAALLAALADGSETTVAELLTDAPIDVVAALVRYGLVEVLQ